MNSLSDNRSCRIYKKSKRVIECTVSRYPARTYGEGVRRRHLEMGLTQVYLAKLLGANETSVFNWESSRHIPSPGCQRKIERVLGVEP